MVGGRASGRPTSSTGRRSRCSTFARWKPLDEETLLASVAKQTGRVVDRPGGAARCRLRRQSWAGRCRREGRSSTFAGRSSALTGFDVPYPLLAARGLPTCRRSRGLGRGRALDAGTLYSDVAYEFKLPDLGEGLTEGEIARWLVAEGQDASHEDQTRSSRCRPTRRRSRSASPAAGVVASRSWSPRARSSRGRRRLLVVIGEDGAEPRRRRGPSARGEADEPLVSVVPRRRPPATPTCRTAGARRRRWPRCRAAGPDGADRGG